MSESISFEHAADFYDATRALPDEVAAKLTDALMRELARVGADRLLEVGVGTGRVSRPLMARGIRVLGCDIAPGMMGRLRAQLGPDHTSPDLMLADATRLPLAEGSVPAALMVHVLHLVASMPDAVAEVARVIEPGGVFLHALTRTEGKMPWQGSAELWNEALARYDFVRRRRPEPEAIHAALESHGATLRVEQYGTHEARITPREMFEQTRKRIHSWSWEFPDDLFEKVFRDWEPRFRAHYSDLDRPLIEVQVHEVEVWTFP